MRCFHRCDWSIHLFHLYIFFFPLSLFPRRTFLLLLLVLSWFILLGLLKRNLFFRESLNSPFFFFFLSESWSAVLALCYVVEGGKNAGSATIWQRRWCITQSFWAILRSKDDASEFVAFLLPPQKKTNINLYHTLSLSYRSTGKNLGLSENRGQQFALDRYYISTLLISLFYYVSSIFFLLRFVPLI